MGKAVSNWTQLSNAIGSAPANTPTTIHISQSIIANTTIYIPADRDITLVSTVIAPGEARVLRRTTNNSGGVRVHSGGTFIMREGSIMENNRTVYECVVILEARLVPA